MNKNKTFLRQRQRALKQRLDPRWQPVTSTPVLGGANIRYEVSGRTRAIGCGGLGLLQKVVETVGLREAIDDRVGWGNDLDYMHARYYSPRIARFLTLDAILGTPEDPQTWNRYTYARDNPITSFDPDGREGRLHGFHNRHANRIFSAEGPEEREAAIATFRTENIGNGLAASLGTAIVLLGPGILDAIGFGGLENDEGEIDPDNAGPQPKDSETDETFVPDEYYERRGQEHAPVHSAPYGRHDRTDRAGNLRETTTYDRSGDRIRQFEVGEGARHGGGYHEFDYDERRPRHRDGGGTRSKHKPFKRRTTEDDTDQ